MKYDRGFTLIEIMVVVIIVGIVTATVILSIGTLGDNREMLREGRRVSMLLQTARDESVLQGREYGLEVVEAGYRFVEFNPFTRLWSDIIEDDMYRYRRLPENYLFELYVEDRPLILEAEPAVLARADKPKERDNDDEDAAFYSPHILVFSSGEVTPFELRIVRRSDRQAVKVTATAMAEFEVSEIEN